MITKLVEGSIKVQWITVDSADALNVLKSNYKNRKLKLHRYFKHFSLSPDDFDVLGNMEYRSYSEIDKRGGWPYYLPVHCKRYGLKVGKKYDNKND